MKHDAGPSEADSLHAVVVRIHYVNSALAVYHEGPGVVQSPRLAARPAPDAQRLSFRREFLHPAVFVLHDIKTSIGSAGEIVGHFHLARLAASLAAELAKFSTVGRVDAEAVVVRIGHDQIAVAVDAQATGPAIAVIGRGPSRPDVFAGEIEPLNPGAVIDDEKPIVPVDGRCSRLGEFAVVGAETSPDRVGLRRWSATRKQERGNEQHQAPASQRHDAPRITATNATGNGLASGDTF